MISKVMEQMTQVRMSKMRKFEPGWDSVIVSYCQVSVARRTF